MAQGREDQGAPQPPADASSTPLRKSGSSWRRILPRRQILLIILIVLAVFSFNISPVWRLLWYWPILSIINFNRVKTPDGRRVEAWRWVESGTIRVQYLDPRDARSAETVAEGVRDLLRETGVALTVEVRPASAEVKKAYDACLSPSFSGVPGERAISFLQMQSQMAALREGDTHADVLIVPDPILETGWAFGMADFHAGLCLIRNCGADRHTGKHEAGHLIGYMMHDAYPLFIFGYPWEGWPWSRDTLMILKGTEDRLSPRARDALRSFWRRVELRTGKLFLTDKSAPEKSS